MAAEVRGLRPLGLADRARRWFRLYLQLAMDLVTETETAVAEVKLAVSAVSAVLAAWAALAGLVRTIIPPGTVPAEMEMEPEGDEGVEWVV